MSHQSALTRQWILLQAVSARRYGATVKELAEEHEVSLKTIRRDLVMLQSAGLPLEETVVEHGLKRWRIDPARWQAIMRFVPNNDADRKPDRQERLSAKAKIPTHMLLAAGEKPEVHYLWDIRRQNDVPWEGIRVAARGLTALGWGVDMAYADAMPATEEEVEKIPGVRWHPKPVLWRVEGMLRVPTTNADNRENTLNDLKNCHQSLLSRIEHGRPLHMAEKPRVFDRVFYMSVERPIGRPYRVFELHDADGSRVRYPHAKLIHIAGMVRHFAIEQMKRDPPEEVDEGWVRRYVAGHQDTEDEKAGKPHAQFSYVPLPSLRRISEVPTDPAVRLVMLSAPIGDDLLLQHLAKRLEGPELKPFARVQIDQPIFLAKPVKETVSYLYTKPANTWASVTPVILPGHDDHKPGKTRRLIERALQQSGIDQPCDFEWSAFSHFPKSLSAHKYDRNGKVTGYIRPDHLLSQTAVHLKLRFNDDLKVPGPLVIGAGRHCGFGLMAGIDP